MSKDMLMWDETLFRDPDVFEIDHVPEQFNYREDQMRELAFQLRPGIKGARPMNTLCKGLPGTGKTTSVRKIFTDVEEATKKIVPVYINCQIDNTKFAIFSQIYRKMSGHLPPASGTSFKQVYEAVARLLVDNEQVLVVALDDANYLLYENQLNSVLYTLLRSHESYPGTRISVILILSDLDIDISREIDARVASVFVPAEIYFPPYNDDEIRNILHERVLQGLYPGCLPDDLFDLVVAQTGKSGDLRVGIDLLKRAAYNAERKARRIIEREDICRAYEISKLLHLSLTARTLSGEEKTVFRTIAERSKTGKEMNAGEVYKEVKEKVTLGYTRFYEIVKKLDAMRLVNLEYREAKGRTRLIRLRYDPDRVLQHLG